jgi:hypothetical protein
MALPVIPDYILEWMDVNELDMMYEKGDELNREGSAGWSGYRCANYMFVEWRRGRGMGADIYIPTDSKVPPCTCPQELKCLSD